MCTLVCVPHTAEIPKFRTLVPEVPMSLRFSPEEAVAALAAVAAAAAVSGEKKKNIRVFCRALSSFSHKLCLN